MKLFALSAAVLALASISAMSQAPYRHGPKPGPDAGPADAMPAKPPVPPSHFLNVTFQGHTVTFSVEDLLKLPQITVNVHNAHRNADESYSGPLLADLLAKAGLSSAHENEALILHSSLVATATDHYFVLYSVAEVEPAFSTGKVIVAVMKAGEPNTEGGLIQLVNTTDTKPARWIHGLAGINVETMHVNP